VSRKSLVPIQLPADPTDPLEAATKQYVDAHAGGSTDVVWVGTSAPPDPNIELWYDTDETAGVALDQPTADALYVNTTGDTLTGPLTLAGNPASALQAATKQYVDLGIKWDVIPVADRWVTPGGAGGTASCSSGYPQWIPVFCSPCTINGLGIEVTTAGAAATTINLAIFYEHPTLAQPYQKLAECVTTVAGDSLGWKSAAMTPTAWPGGRMWLGCVPNGGNPVLRGVTGFGEPWVMFDVAQVPPNLTYRSWTYVMGATWPAYLPTTLGLAAGANPKIAFKVA